MEGNVGGCTRDVSPARSSANLKSTGPIISLIATVAIASARNDGPIDGNSRAMMTDSPRASPAWDTRPDQAHRRSTGASVAILPPRRQPRHGRNGEGGARRGEEDDVDDGPGLLDVRRELVPLLRHVADDEARDDEREEGVELQVLDDRADAEAEHEQDDEHLAVDQAQIGRDDQAERGPERDAADDLVAERRERVEREGRRRVDERTDAPEDQRHQNDDDDV